MRVITRLLDLVQIEQNAGRQSKCLREALVSSDNLGLSKTRTGVNSSSFRCYPIKEVLNVLIAGRINGS
jgi:hypothetical protein